MSQTILGAVCVTCLNQTCEIAVFAVVLFCPKPSPDPGLLLHRQVKHWPSVISTSSCHAQLANLSSRPASSSIASASGENLKCLHTPECIASFTAHWTCDILMDCAQVLTMTCESLTILSTSRLLWLYHPELKYTSQYLQQARHLHTASLTLAFLEWGPHSFTSSVSWSVRRFHCMSSLQKLNVAMHAYCCWYGANMLLLSVCWFPSHYLLSPKDRKSQLDN